MPSALMYHGGFEANFATLKPGATSFTGTDGKPHELPPWPAEATSVRVGYMEKPGKKFVAVRLLDSKVDIVLKNEVLIDPTRHLGTNKRFGAAPTVVSTELIVELLKDCASRNPEQLGDIAGIRGRLGG